MLRAAIDTSSSHAAFAVTADDASLPLLKLGGIPLGRQTGSLPGQILTALKSHGVDINAIQYWTIGMGPGSFTGIRVGAALVKGICAGSNATYRGVPSSLAMVMAAAPSNATTAIALHDGRRSEVLVSPYRRVSQGWEPSAEPFPLKITDLPGQAAECVVILKTDRALAEVESTCSELTVLEEFPIEQLTYALPSFCPSEPREQEASCSPVYVRPAVFVEPTLKK